MRADVDRDVVVSVMPQQTLKERQRETRLNKYRPLNLFYQSF